MFLALAHAVLLLGDTETSGADSESVVAQSGPTCQTRAPITAELPLLAAPSFLL